jgi:hypothetical protein
MNVIIWGMGWEGVIREGGREGNVRRLLKGNKSFGLVGI